MKLIHIRITVLVLFLTPFAYAESWREFTQHYSRAYKSMEIPRVVPSYIGYLGQLQDQQALHNQRQQFLRIIQDLKGFQFSSLSPKEKIEFDLIQYESQLNLERIKLGLQWLKQSNRKLPSGGLTKVTLGKRWYEYLLKHWVDSSVTPNRVFSLGLSEIDRVKAQINKIQIASGLSEPEFERYIESTVFFYKNPGDVQIAFESAQKEILEKLPSYFPYIQLIGPTNIARGQNKELAKVPAYYQNSSLYFNFFGKLFNRRQIYWIYFHEALPGHHYQIQLALKLEEATFRSHMNYPGYIEGWAAYVEDLAVELNLYDDIYSELGKWEWDLIRSVRLVLDVGLNHRNWSDSDAMSFWSTHIKGLDDIGKREIDRMRRWPAQVVTYKYGAKQFLKWKLESKGQNNTSLYNYHKTLMDIGPLPLTVLNKHFQRQFSLASGL